MAKSSSTGRSSTKNSAAGKVRVGLIGCGAIGQRRHIPEAASNPNVMIVALCDPNLARAKEVAAKYGVTKTFANHKDMLAKCDLDLVVVGTPNAFHAPQSIDALNAGCHVLVEKPMAGSETEARAMIAAAKKAGKLLMVGQNQRLMPPHVLAKNILDGGMMGKPINFQTTFKHPGPQQWSVDGWNSWFFRKQPAVMGVCGDLGVHKVDLMMYLLGEPITQVNGFIDRLTHTFPDSGRPIEVEDTAFLTVRTASGVIGTVNISWTQFGSYEDNGTTIYCENGVLSLANNPEYPVIVHMKDGTKTFHKTGAVATNTRQVSSGVLDEMINAIRENRPPLIDGAEGLRALKVILAAIDSAKTGRTGEIVHG